MTFSNKELLSHTARRLGYGTEPGLLIEAASVDDVASRALDLSAPPAVAPDLAPPGSIEEARSREQTEPIYRFWLEQMVSGRRRIEERLVWFWHDHFATDIRKVRIPYLMFQQHLTVRAHATGSFADLLHAIAVDPAMLIYLDGVRNASEQINENFGREVMELFTVGRGQFTEQDVIEASRAFSGWVVVRPGTRAAERFDVAPWKSVFVPFRHDDGIKTLLGRTGDLDARDVVDALLDHPATAAAIAAKLYQELVGLRPDPDSADRVAGAFRRDYQIMDLVEAIATDAAFVSEEAVRTRVRTPLEKAVGLIQAFGAGPRTGRVLLRALESIGYVPFRPPNVAGFPKGRRLLGPHQLVHTFDLAALYPRALPTLSTDKIFNRLGVFDVSTESRSVLDASPTRYTRMALAANSPEFHVV